MLVGLNGFVGNHAFFVDVVSVVDLVVLVLAALVAGSTGILHAVGVVGLAFHHFEAGSDLLLALRTPEALRVPVLFHRLELLAHNLLVTAGTGELTDFLSTSDAVGLVILHGVLAVGEPFFTFAAHKTGGMVVITTHIYHSLFNKHTAFETLLQIGFLVTPFTHKLVVVFNVPTNQLVLTNITFETILMEITFSN